MKDKKIEIILDKENKEPDFYRKQKWEQLWKRLLNETKKPLTPPKDDRNIKCGIRISSALVPLHAGKTESKFLKDEFSFCQMILKNPSKLYLLEI